MNDSDIVILFFNRSESAISEVQRKYGAYCYSIAFNILRSAEDSEECVNESYLRVWNSIPPNKPNNLRTYIGKIVRNLSINLLRNRSATKRIVTESVISMNELDEYLSDHSNLNSLDYVDLGEILNRFLQTLSKKHRIMFVQKYWYMKTIKEISIEHGISESNVKVILSRTREKLKKFLAKEGVFL